MGQIHRLGRPNKNKNRPVILKLLDSRNKATILKKGYKLKNTNYSIGEDFSRRVREKRRKLWESTKSNREKGEKVSLFFYTLYIIDSMFVWDDERNMRVAVHKNAERSRPVTRSNKHSQQ